MPGTCNRRRSLAVRIRVTVILSLTIAVVTAVIATLLYVVFGQQTSKTSTPVHALGDYRPVANTRVVSEERLIPENRSTVKYLAPNRRSMNGRPWASTGIRIPLVNSGIHDISTNQDRYLNNHRHGTSDGGVATPEKYDETGDVTFDTETQQNTIRQINHIDYSNLETDNWRTEKDGSTGYHDSLDLTYNMDDYSNKPTDDLAGINDLHRDPGVELDSQYSTIYGPYPNRPSVTEPIMDQSSSTVNKLPSKSYQPPTRNYQLPNPNYQLPNTNYYQPSDIIYQPPSTKYNTPSTSYVLPKISVPQKPILESPQKKIETPVPNTGSAVDWRLIGILSLIKLGIVKLKSIAIIKALLFLVFSLKLLLIIVSFKFILLFKFFKAMMLQFLSIPPLLISLLFPMILSSLFSIPGRLIRFLFTPNNPTSQPSNTTPSLPTIIPSSMNNVISSIPSRPVVIRPGTTGITNPPAGIVSRPVIAPATQISARNLEHFLPNKNGTLSTKSDTLHLPHRWHSESLEVLNPIMDVFWNIIDSEECVERIACRMAVTKEAGTMPMWINWAMRGVSKFIPNKKLQSYFKTYDDINNEVLTNPQMRTDSWNSLCLEHYNCKSTNVTHDTDI